MSKIRKIIQKLETYKVNRTKIKKLKQTQAYKQFIQKLPKEFHVKNIPLASFCLATYGFNCGSESRKNYYRTYSSDLINRLDLTISDLLDEETFISIIGHKFEQREFIRYLFKDRKTRKFWCREFFGYDTHEGKIMIGLHALDISFGWE